jgi:diguanylate cyclase (GGDEF)-like protein
MFSGKERSAILIVDDETANIRALSNAIDPGHEVLFTTSGEKALLMLEEKEFDIVLLDVTMPGISGFEVCDQIQKLSACGNIPVIFVTANITEEDETKGLKFGAVDYITKPFRNAIVRMRVRNHLKTKKQCDYLANLSNMDGLTQIPNRRFFDESIKKEWARSARSQSTLSLLMIDIDSFKKYNDNYGHAEGDSCLKHVAQTLASTLVRTTDFVARYGGEEFVCVLPETDLNGAMLIAEKMRDKIEKLKIPHLHSQVTDHITISLGGYELIPNSDLTPQDLVKLADKNLYLAKNRGRNQVVCTD